jgi:hypothetical protein
MIFILQKKKKVPVRNTDMEKQRCGSSDILFNCLLPTASCILGFVQAVTEMGSIVLPYTYSTVDCLLRQLDLIISLPVPG